MRGIDVRAGDVQVLLNETATMAAMALHHSKKQQRSNQNQLKYII